VLFCCKDESIKTEEYFIKREPVSTLINKEKPDIFFHVCWITMSQEFSIHPLQDLIAEAFGLCLPKGKDVTSRDGELWTALRFECDKKPCYHS